MGAILSQVRFAGWKPFPARLLIAALAALGALAVLATLATPSTQSAPAPQSSAAAVQEVRDADLQLYHSVVEWVRRGDNYYDAAIAEQRAR